MTVSLRLCLLTLLCTCGLASLSAQLVVEERPEIPAAAAKRTLPVAEPGYLVTADGWAVKDGKYTFLAARVVKERPGFEYVPGKWKKVKGGWTFRPEEWVAKNTNQGTGN